MIKMQLTLNPSELDHMAEDFYGYGRWDAPFWFIGPEAGMAKTGDSLEQRFQSWETLEFEPVVDCAAHHRGFGLTKWHQPHPPTQATWRKLICLLLAFKGQPNGIEAIRVYQRDEWGSSTGETCLIELSGLASPNMRTQQDRTTFLTRRMKRIREEMLIHLPEFVVMYGEGQRLEWEKIAGTKFDSNGLCRAGRTAVAVALHPVSLGLGNEYWTTLGRLLQSTVRSSSEV